MFLSHLRLEIGKRMRGVEWEVAVFKLLGLLGWDFYI